MMVQKKVCEQDIVITGVSGRYPQSENVEELWENLMNSKVLYRKDEFPYPKIFSRIPVVRGALKDASKFDHEFFGFNEIEAHSLDPQIRLLLEVVYESMWDAGIAPVEWRGTRTGFFLGSSFDDTGLSVRWDHKIDFPQYFSQRISHYFDFRGPTMIVDTACASSLNALHQAYWSMKQGECDQAIVAGISVHLKPLISIGFAQLEMLSKSGGSYGLDSAADGYVRSEAIVSVVLQKQSQAKRICAKIISSVTSSDGYTKEGITFPSEQVQIETMKAAIRSAGLTGLEVNYVEAHITGTPAGDPIESSSILNSYRGVNPKPITIGCLKSNIGHSEASAGLCAVSKVLKIFETGLIPPIVKLNNPNPRVIGLMTRILPVEKVTPFADQYIGIDAFGFGGANTHCIVQSPMSLMDNRKSKSRMDNFPHLICLCNRTRSGIEEMFRFFNHNCHKLTSDYTIMLNSICSQSDTGMKWKGFAILDGCVDDDGGGGRGNRNHRSLICGSIDRVVDGEQSLGLIIGPNIDDFLGKLLENKIFHQLVEDVDSFLGGKGIKNVGKKSSQNSAKIHSDKFVLRVAFIDLLHKMKIYPDWIACQSSDKIVAQYAFDMANREDIKQHLISKPDLINGNSNPPSDNGHQFIIKSSEHKQRNSLSKNYRFMEAVIEKIKDFDLLKNNQSSEKNSEIHFIGRKASTFESKNLSTMNIIYLNSEVRFIKSSSSIDSTLINKTSKSSSNSIRSFLNSLGQLFISGYPMDINQLYPAPKYPIAHDSPRIGHLVKWNHERSFDNMIYPEFFRPSFHTVHRFDLLDANFADLAGYFINGKEILPAAGYLWIIWDHLVKMRCVDQKLRNHSFEIWSTTIHHQTSITEPIEFRMVSNPVTHEFSIKLGTKIFVTGFARIVDEEPYDYSQHLVPKDLKHSKVPLKLESDHFYHEMMIRGFQISDSYCVLNNALADGSRGEIKFNGNWIIFTQACLQMCLLQDQDRCLSLPTHFEWLRSDPPLIYESIKLKRKAKDESGLTVSMCKSTNIVATDGLVFKIPGHQIIGRELVPKNLHYKTQIFLPFESKIPLDKKLALQKAEYSEKCDQLLKLLNQMGRNEIKNLQSTAFYGEYTPQQPGDVLEILSQSRKEKNWKKFLTNELVLKKCSPKLMIIDVVMDIAGHLIDLFEENAPNDSTITIKQVGCNSFDFQKELDFRFRRIRNRYEFEIEDPTSSDDLKLGTEDLLIVNHFSLLILPSKNPSYYSEKWKDAVKAMKPSSFVLINTRDSLVNLEKTLAQVLISDVNDLESSESLETLMLSNEFVLISKLSSEDSDIKSMLFRKKPKIDLTKSPLIIPISSGNGYQWVENIKNSIKNDENERIWLITSDSYENGITGLGCSLREEKFGSKIRIIFAPNWDIRKNEGIFQLMQAKDLVINMRKNDQWGTLRHIEMDPHDEVRVLDRENILKWSFEPRNDDSDCSNPIPMWFRAPKIDLNETYALNFYSSLTFSDYSYAQSTNLIGKPKLNNPWESSIGHEFAGINQNGQKIAGLCITNGISNTIDKSNILFEFETPEDWSLKDLSTVPLAYFMAYYALKEIAHLQPGSSLLINGMKDGIGEAILSIGSEMNYNMIVIVQTEATRKHLRNIFPRLNDDQVIIKPSQITVDEVILRATNGYGLETIVNLDSNTDINGLADCSTLDGLIIDFTNDESINSKKLDKTRLPNNATLINICVNSFISNMASEPTNYQRTRSRITDHIRIGMKNGQIRPITSIIYEKDQIDDAFDQLINNPDYSGKIIIKIRDENSSQIISSSQTVSPSILSKLESATIPVKCVARTSFYPHKWYIILGGLGGVGLQLAQFMVSRGARKIVLSSRSGIKDQFQKYVIQRIESNYPDANIMVHQEASPTQDSCLNLTQKLKRSGPIGGIFNLAAVLSSGIFENQTPESFRAACAPKVELTKYWDSVTRQECPELDYFLVFSSVSSHGLLGEANYSYANSCVERLIEERRQIGLPGLAIQYGKIGDVGMATEYRSDIAGSAAQNIWSVIEALDKFLQLPYSVCYSVVHAAKQEDTDDSKAGLLQRIGHILGLKNLEALDSTVTLGDLGLDSLQAIEVQNLIESTCMVVIPNIGIMKLTIADLIELRDQAAQSALPNGSTDQQGKPSDLMRVKSYHEEILITLYDNSGPPIFFFPPALFDFLSMLPLAQAMSRKVIGLDLNDQVRELGSMGNIAEFYCDEILKNYPNEVKYDFVGYSYGCLLGFEVAKVMQERLGKDRCDRIVFIDASPYGLKKLGQFTLNSVMEGRSIGDIFCETMGHMGVKVNDSMRQKLLDAEDDDDRYSELVSEVMAGAGMNGPADAFSKNATNMVDRGYYMSGMDDMGIFHGNALFIQVVNKAHHGKQSLVNAGLSEIIDGKIEVVTYDASHFAILQSYGKDIAKDIEKMMPL